MNDEFGVDLDEVFKLIDTAEVLIVRFHIVQKRLLVDFRTKPGVGTFGAVVPRAESIEDRFRSIRRMRPDFGAPERVMSFAWPRSMAAMRASGAWAQIAERMIRLGGSEAAHLMDQLERELFTEERLEIAGAIRGAEHYQTVWERQPA